MGEQFVIVLLFLLKDGRGGGGASAQTNEFSFGYICQINVTFIGFQEDKGGKADSRSVNKDGLVYSTIQFTQEQLKKAEAAPPERETTEYVSIAFGRHAPQQSD